MSIKQDEKVMSESHSKEQGVEHIGADIPSAFSKSLHSEKADESGLASGSAPLLTGDFLSSQDSSASFSLSSNLYKSSESFQNDVSGMSSFGSDLDLSSENSILSRIQVFEDASEAELPIDADRSVSSGGKGTKIGSVLDGKYRIERTVAKGGMGVVYCANHVKLNKTFAIKVISPTTLAHEEAHKRFFREAKASTLLTNPHTVRVFDYGVSLWGEPYLVMEFVSGDNLHKAVKEQGAFEPRRVVSVIKQITQSLLEVHNNGLVHRDLKPSNVMLLDIEGHEEDFVKIFDFGVVKFVTAPDDSDLTRQGAMLGTPRYMAPEQIFSPGNVTFAADIYALALIFYFMIEGKRPFNDKPSDTLAQQKFDKNNTKLSKKLNLPRRLRHLYTQMTAIEPESRPSTQEVLTTLNMIEQDLNIGAFGGIDFPFPKENSLFTPARIFFVFLFALVGGLWAFWPSSPKKEISTPAPFVLESQFGSNPKVKKTLLKGINTKKNGIANAILPNKVRKIEPAPPSKRAKSEEEATNAAFMALQEKGARSQKEPVPPRFKKIKKPLQAWGTLAVKKERARKERAKKKRARKERARKEKARKEKARKERVKKKIEKVSKITISSSPSGAKVYSGGRYIGTTPMSVSKHYHQKMRFRLKRRGFFSTSISIPAGTKRKRFRAQLREIRIELP